MRADPLNFVAKLSHPAVAARAQELRRTGSVSAPMVLDLDPTSFCDLACPECISSSLLNEDGFRSDRLLSLCDELSDAGVRGVIFIGGGEPLMHRATPSAIRRLASRGVQVAMVTNGTQLRRLDPPTVALLSWLRVSVDAATPETFALLRPSKNGKSKFGEVVDGISYSVDSNAQQLGFSFVALVRPTRTGHVSNIVEIPAAARLAKTLGCDYIEFKAQLACDHQVDPEMLRNRAAIKLAIDEALLENSPNFRVLISSTLASVLRNDPPQQKGYRSCQVSMLHATVTPRGLYPCAYHRGDHKLNRGDLMAKSFQEVWDHVSADDVDPSADCPFYCARHSLNLALSQPSTLPVSEETEDLFL
jgi:MoaA/NifB/PqqE/SkfB family radical SAM enzyme